MFLWRHQFQETYVVFLVQNSELLGLSRICGFDHFGAMFDLAVCLDLTTLVLFSFSIWQCALFTGDGEEFLEGW